jgi:hypothetical protein
MPNKTYICTTRDGQGRSKVKDIPEVGVGRFEIRARRAGLKLEEVKKEEADIRGKGNGRG